MRIVLINPFDRSVVAASLPNDVRSFREHLGERSISAGRLPNGDQLLVGRDVRSHQRFSVGGSKPHAGFGVVVGPLREGEFKNSTSRLDDIARLVRFSEIPDYEFESTPAALDRDVDKLAAHLKTDLPIYVDVVPLTGAEHGWCWQNVAKIAKSQGGRAVYGWTIWQRPRLFVTAEYHAVWETPHGHMIDVTPKTDGEETIAFSADRSCPADFDFSRRPNNQRLRTYSPPEVDVPSIMQKRGSAGRVFARKNAAKRGMTIEEAIKEKNADPLATAIDLMFATCKQIEDIVDVYPDGQFCKFPGKLAKLELQKALQHNRMMELARERFGRSPDTNAVMAPSIVGNGSPQP